MIIEASHLYKTFKVSKKTTGIASAIGSFFHRKYEEVHAVRDVSFQIDEGELVGFIGPNGAGKTTTLKCLSGLILPSDGTVRVMGYAPFDRKKDFLKKLSLVMGQKNQLWWDLPAQDTFLLNKAIYEIEDKQYNKTLGELVELLDVGKLLSTQVRKLSLGERMKMELISSLLHTPKVLFLDEPTIGLDVVMQKQLRDFIRTYNTKHNSTILLTSHYMEDVQQLAKRVIIIDHGSVLYDGLLEKLFDTFATHKKISVQIDKKVSLAELKKVGPVESYDFPRVVWQVPRAKTKLRSTQILKSFAVTDLTIEEPDIEEVIRDVFSRKNQQMMKSEFSEQK